MLNYLIILLLIQCDSIHQMRLLFQGSQLVRFEPIRVLPEQFWNWNQKQNSQIYFQVARLEYISGIVPVIWIGEAKESSLERVRQKPKQKRGLSQINAHGGQEKMERVEVDFCSPLSAFGNPHYSQTVTSYFCFF